MHPCWLAWAMHSVWTGEKGAGGCFFDGTTRSLYCIFVPTTAMFYGRAPVVRRVYLSTMYTTSKRRGIPVFFVRGLHTNKWISNFSNLYILFEGIQNLGECLHIHRVPVPWVCFYLGNYVWLLLHFKSTAVRDEIFELPYSIGARVANKTLKCFSADSVDFFLDNYGKEFYILFTSTIAGIGTTSKILWLGEINII